VDTISCMRILFVHTVQTKDNVSIFRIYSPHNSNIHHTFFLLAYLTFQTFSNDLFSFRSLTTLCRTQNLCYVYIFYFIVTFKLIYLFICKWISILFLIALVFTPFCFYLWTIFLGFINVNFTTKFSFFWIIKNCKSIWRFDIDMKFLHCQQACLTCLLSRHILYFKFATTK
jgi:hypothetical protein